MHARASGYVASLVTQAWKLRVSFRGGMLRTADGSPIYVPPFDLGFVPPFSKNEPRADPQGNRLVQRVPFNVSGG